MSVTFDTICALLCWIFYFYCNMWCVCVMFGRVRRYVSHDTLCYVTIRALTFVTPCYFSLCYVNFYFVMLTQYGRYILYASWFNFYICVLVMIILCALIFQDFIALFLCVMFCVYSLHFCCLMLYLLHVLLRVLAFCHNSRVIICFVISICALTFMTLEFTTRATIRRPRVTTCDLTI